MGNSKKTNFSGNKKLFKIVILLNRLLKIIIRRYHIKMSEQFR
jgi:hypothetical protein